MRLTRFICLAAAAAILLLGARAAFADAPAGPLVVKAFMSPYDSAPGGDPTVRVFLGLKNPSGSACTISDFTIEYIDAQKTVLQTDHGFTGTVGAGEDKKLPQLYFPNYNRNYGIVVKMTVKYANEGKDCVKTVEVSNQNPAVPPDYRGD